MFFFLGLLSHYDVKKWRRIGAWSDSEVLVSSVAHWLLQAGQSLHLLLTELPKLCSLAPVLPWKLLHKHRDLKGEAAIQEVS